MLLTSIAVLFTSVFSGARLFLFPGQHLHMQVLLAVSKAAAGVNAVIRCGSKKAAKLELDINSA